MEARDLACVRGGRLVFEDVSFSVGAGELLVLVGPNGAGKSSLLRIAAGLLRPHRGALDLRQTSPEDGALHYLGHLDGLKPAFSLAETLRFWATLYGRGKPTDANIAEAAAAVGLGHALALPVGVLSAGQRRRAGLARLLASPRPLWLLDEPASALDRDGEDLLRRMMAAHLAAGGAILAAAHGDLPVRPSAVLDFGGAV